MSRHWFIFNRCALLLFIFVVLRSFNFELFETIIKRRVSQLSLIYFYIKTYLLCIFTVYTTDYQPSMYISQYVNRSIG